VLLGVDGATWDIVRPMMAKGELPTFSRLVETGASGPLASLEPTLSNRVWTCASTGVVPDRHGITDFFFDRRFIKVPTIWDLVHARGGRVGLFEYLVTDPPLPFHGFVLPGWMAYNPTNTHPPGLTQRLRIAASVRHPWEVARYFATRARVDPRHAQRMMLEAKLVATGFLFLHERYRPDLAACVFYGTDRLGHTSWRYFQPEAYDEPLPPGGEAFRETLPRYYREADRQLGRILSSLDDDHTLFVVMSDHGMGAMDSVRVAGHTRGLRALQRLGLADRWYVENPHGEMFLNCKLPGRVDLPTVKREEQATVVEEAAARFAAVEIAASGEKIFHVELGDFEKVDLKITIPNPRALTLETPLRYEGETFSAEEIIQLVELSGTHRIDGIVLLDGPGVVAERPVDGAVITDIAPTILWALGLPVAEDLDGRVMTGAFSESWVATHPLDHVATFGTLAEPDVPPTPPTDELLEKLRGLGYIN
jgi:predicted AlkP superfamily phosphohydrolase/phosphomutase